MIEINRKVYMDEVSGDKSANFETTAKAVWDLLEAIKGV
jgi:N-formylglutamate amidohydrolase